MLFICIAVSVISYLAVRYSFFKERHLLSMSLGFFLISFSIAFKLTADIMTDSEKNGNFLYVLKFNDVGLLVSVAAAAIMYLAVYSFFSLKRQGHIIPRFRRKVKRKRDFLYAVICSLLISFGLFFFFACSWLLDTFGDVDVNQIIYHVREPVTGSAFQQIESFMSDVLAATFFAAVLLLSTLWLLYNYRFVFSKEKRSSPKNEWHWVGIPLSMMVCIVFCFFGLAQFGVQEVWASIFGKTAFYDKYYVAPEKTKVTFPEEKRNLIYVFAESVENTYLAESDGGTQKESLMPNLTELAYENINFSNTSAIGGALPVSGTTFTIGGMVANTAGVPLKTNFSTGENENVQENNYGDATDFFLPGVYSIGEILENEGYNQTIMFGSDAAFAGRDKYFSQHGNYEIKDYKYARGREWIPDGYYVWWGYEDEKLFEFAKEELLALASEPEPFNLTLLTVDTHFEDGYESENTPDLFGDKYSNVIHWSDELIADFVAFVEEQDFYEDTTIVIVGDHLSMDTDFFDNDPDDYVRTTYNVIINSAVETENTNNRQFSSMDFYPTTLAALGAEVRGERLGLGTNLFSDKETLIEKVGYEEFKQEMMMVSSYYIEHLMWDQVNTGDSSSE